MAGLRDPGSARVSSCYKGVLSSHCLQGLLTGGSSNCWGFLSNIANAWRVIIFGSIKTTRWWQNANFEVSNTNESLSDCTVGLQMCNTWTSLYWITRFNQENDAYEHLIFGKGNVSRASTLHLQFVQILNSKHPKTRWIFLIDQNKSPHFFLPTDLSLPVFLCDFLYSIDCL